MPSRSLGDLQSVFYSGAQLSRDSTGLGPVHWGLLAQHDIYRTQNQGFTPLVVLSTMFCAL